MNAEQYMNANAEILEEEYVDSVMAEVITKDLAEEAARDRAEGIEDGDDLPGGLIPFGDIATGTRFISLDAEGEPVEFIKLYEDTDAGRNACEISTGRLVALQSDEPCSLDTWLAD